MWKYSNSYFWPFLTTYTLHIISPDHRIWLLTGLEILLYLYKPWVQLNTNVFIILTSLLFKCWLLCPCHHNFMAWYRYLLQKPDGSWFPTCVQSAWINDHEMAKWLLWKVKVGSVRGCTAWGTEHLFKCLEVIHFSKCNIIYNYKVFIVHQHESWLVVLVSGWNLFCISCFCLFKIKLIGQLIWN